MDVKTTIPISEARRRFFEINDEVQIPGRYYMFTEKGRPKSVLMSAEEFESWQETLEVMRDFPNLKKDIMESEKEYKRGEYMTLEDLLKEEGITLSYHKKKNALLRRRSKKSKKTT